MCPEIWEAPNKYMCLAGLDGFGKQRCEEGFQGRKMRGAKCDSQGK